MPDPELPILGLRSELLAAVGQQRRLILTAPTGSGKSTQVPQLLRDGGRLGDGQVVILQPRRLAARLLARWVAQQRHVTLGAEVGYQIRFEDVTSPATRIRYVTEGVLLRQMLGDPELRGMTAVLFDEFHERHLYGDVTLARTLELQESTRPDLIIGVMSATLDIRPLEKYLQPCTVLSSPGRTHPVDIEYLTKPVASDSARRAGGPFLPVWDVAIQELVRLLGTHPEGDALVFMPGAYEISRAVQAARAALGREFIVLPLHGELSVADQDAAVARYAQRKVVVATNVAETSVTIDGVRLVIDSGLARVARYDPHRGINTLLVEKISRAAADQRAGRAGRTAPGLCLRLWTEREHESRPPQELPEIKRLDLAEVVLTLKAGGVGDVHQFRWLEPPEPAALARAETLLSDLGALAPTASHGADGPSGLTITPLGERMLAFPLHPRYARMLLAAQEYRCVRAVALIAALTQGRDVLLRNQGRPVEEARAELFGGESESDLFVLMRAWRYAERSGYNVGRCQHLGIQAQAARQVGPLFEQFLEIARREGLDVREQPTANEAIQRCVLAGFADHVARRLDVGTLRCALVHGRRGVLARESVVTAPLLVVTEIAEVQGRDLNVVLRLATAVKEEWLRELFPADFQETDEVAFEATLRRVVRHRQRRFRDLIVATAAADNPPLETAARILAQEVAAGRCVLKHWDEAVNQWLIRVSRLREWMPELGLPEIGEPDKLAMIEMICQGAVSYKEIKDRPVGSVVRGWLSPHQQQAVNQHAPERIELPRGHKAKVTYPSDGPPTIAARIQDLYGVTASLRIAAGRVPVVIQVLAPNHRPIQVTQNLAVFWQETYPKIKQELQRKYPKHQWR